MMSLRPTGAVALTLACISFAVAGATIDWDHPVPWDEVSFGDEVVVEGPVASTAYSEGSFYINIGRPCCDPERFVVHIPPDCVDDFKAEFSEDLEGFFQDITLQVYGLIGRSSDGAPMLPQFCHPRRIRVVSPDSDVNGTSTSPEGTLLLSEDFEDGRADGWYLDDGWSVHEEANGNHVLYGEGLWQWAIPDIGFDDTDHPWTDYTVSFRMKLISGGMQVECRLTFEGGRTRYMVGFRENDTWFGKEYPNDTYDDVCDVAPPAPLNIGEWHDVVITLAGARVTVVVDGVLWFDRTDLSDPLLRGGIGFETIVHPPGSGEGGSHVYVDDVEVRGVAPAGQAVAVAGATGCCFGTDCENLPPDECEARGGLPRPTHCTARSCVEQPILDISLASCSCRKSGSTYTFEVRLRVKNVGTAPYPWYGVYYDDVVVIVLQGSPWKLIDDDMWIQELPRLRPGGSSFVDFSVSFDESSIPDPSDDAYTVLVSVDAKLGGILQEWDFIREGSFDDCR